MGHETASEYDDSVSKPMGNPWRRAIALVGHTSSVWLLAAQGVYMVVGYLLTIGLARILSVSDFGIYAITLTIVTWANVVIATGVPQVVSRLLVEHRDSPGAVWAAAVRLQIGLVLGLTVLVVACSPLIASLLGAPGLAVPIVLGALAIPGVGAIALQAGRLSASFHFRRQSIAQVVWNITRTASALVAATVGGVNAALAAIAFSAVPGLIAGGRSRIARTEGDSWRRLLIASVAASLAGLLLVVTGSYDLLLLAAEHPSDAGVYAAAQNLARVPLLLCIPLAGAMLPHAARGVAALVDVRFLLEAGALLAACTTAVIMGAPAAMISLIFGPRFAATGAAPETVLVGALALLGLTTLLVAVMIGRDVRVEPVIALMVALCIGLISAVLLIPVHGMTGAATSTAIASGTALAICVVLVLRLDSAVLWPVAYLRIALVAACLFGAARLLDGSAILVVASALLIVGILVPILRLPPFRRQSAVPEEVVLPHG